MAKKKKYKIKIKVSKIDRNGCHLLLKGKVNGHDVNFVLDTGASQTVFDKKKMETILGHNEFEKAAASSSGLGTNDMDSHLVKIKSLKLGELELKNRLIVLLDLSHVNQSYEMMNMKPIDGAIGGDILKKFEGVIDYSKKLLTLTV